MLQNQNLKKIKIGLNKKSGHNSQGKITVYHHGGGNKICYRNIDFYLNLF